MSSQAPGSQEQESARPIDAARSTRAPDSPSARITRVALWFYGVIGAGSLAALLLRGHASAFGRLDRLPLDAAIGLLLGLAIAASSQAVGESRALRPLAERLREMLRGLTTRQALVLAVCSGVAEELLFRGVMLEELAPRFGTTVALLLTSLLFGLAHASRERRLWIWAGLSFAIGLLLGILRLRTGGLAAPIALHVAVNGLNLLVECWDQRLPAAGARPSSS